MRMTIGEFLLRRLREAGIGHIIGVPGDFNLQFLEQISTSTGISFVGTCNELNAAYAADGYARINGISALLTTYGVGELSALCGVAGACSEHVPVVCITGAPPLHAMERHWQLHHSLADGNFENMLNCYRQFTVDQICLTPANAVSGIDRVLRACLHEKRPVYIQLPSDISFLTVDAPEEALDISWPVGDPERLDAACMHILRLLEHACRPAILLDMDADRYRLAPALYALARKRGISYASLSTGKAILNERDPLFMGLYGGDHSLPCVKELIEEADCLITTAPRFIEANSGLFTQKLPMIGVVDICGNRTIVEGTVYEAVYPAELLARLEKGVASGPLPVVPSPPTVTEWSPSKDTVITQARLWPRLLQFIESGDVLVAEVGTSSIGLTGCRLPSDVTWISSSIWGAIGYSLGALLGTMLADPKRRHILVIGDGSFQLTAQELSTILRLGLKPIIFLINNRGYTIERYILGMHSDYNNVANWQYNKLPQVFVPECDTMTFSISTEAELEIALKEINSKDQAVFVELNLDPFDAPSGLKLFGPATAEFDYGPRGPQKNTTDKKNI